MVSVSTCAMYLASAVVSLSKQMKITGFRAQWCCGCTKKKKKKSALGGNSASRIRLAAAEDELIFGEAVKEIQKPPNWRGASEIPARVAVTGRGRHLNTPWGFGRGGAGIQADHKRSLLKEKGCMSAVTSGAGRLAAAALWFVISSLCFLLNKNQRKKNDNVKYVSLFSKFGMAQL